MKNPLRPANRRPMQTKVKVLGRSVYQVGRLVVVPKLDLVEKRGSFQSAEKFLAGIIAGAVDEAYEHPSLTGNEAIRVAWDHLSQDINYYLKNQNRRQRRSTATTGRMAPVT